MDKLWKRALWTLGGVALFILLSQVDLYDAISRVQTYLGLSWRQGTLRAFCLGFVLVPFYAYAFGAAECALVSGLGMLGYFAVYYRLDGALLERFLPRLLGMVLGAAAMGLLLGALFRFIRLWESRLTRLLLYLAATALACAIGLWLVTSLVDAQLPGYGKSLELNLLRNQDWFLCNGVLTLLGALAIVTNRSLMELLAPSLIPDEPND